MICPICRTRFADFPEEDYILDLPVPPEKGIIPRYDDSWVRRLCVYWNDELGECGCNEQIAGVGR
jgi:hypothetical protein